MHLEEHLDEDDLAAIRPTPLQKAAGGMTMIVGLFGLILALQTAGIVRVRGIMLIILPLMALFPPVLLAAGWKTSRGRGWAALLGAVASALYALLAFAWLVFSVMESLFSVIALFLGPASLVAAILSAIATGAGKKADDARERLRAQGLDAGS